MRRSVVQLRDTHVVSQPCHHVPCEQQVKMLIANVSRNDRHDQIRASSDDSNDSTVNTTEITANVSVPRKYVSLCTSVNMCDDTKQCTTSMQWPRAIPCTNLSENVCSVGGENVALTIGAPSPVLAVFRFFSTLNSYHFFIVSFTQYWALID